MSIQSRLKKIYSRLHHRPLDNWHQVSPSTHTANRLCSGDKYSYKFATIQFMPSRYRSFAFDCYRICYQTAAFSELFPTCLKQPILADPSTDKDHIWRFDIFEGFRCPSLDHL